MLLSPVLLLPVAQLPAERDVANMDQDDWLTLLIEMRILDA